MDFRITRGAPRRSLLLVGGNLLLTILMATLLLEFGERHPMTSPLTLGLETATSVIAFLLFVIIAQLRVSGARMSLLLFSLFLYQLGTSIDALSEVLTFPNSNLLIAGSLLTLMGAILLAAVAFHFVQLTLNIANTDRLTELNNRTFHNRWIDTYLERSVHPLGLIAIDLDNFKAVNDAHGHAFGDMVLKHISGLILNFMRQQNGIASRTGGEEFEITLKRCKEVDAKRIAEELRLMIEQNPPNGLDHVTASIGIAISQEGEGTVSLRKRADAAAYYSKQSGRNRVTFAGADQTINSVVDA